MAGADFASLSLWQCDFPEAITAFGLIFDELAEPGPTGQGLFKDLLDGLRDDPEGPRVDLRREVFPHLGPQVLSVVDRSASAEQAAAKHGRSLLVIQCRNAAAVKEALTRFYKADTEVRQGVLGTDPLWTIGPGKSLFVEGGGDTQMPILRRAGYAGRAARCQPSRNDHRPRTARVIAGTRRYVSPMVRLAEPRCDRQDRVSQSGDGRTMVGDALCARPQRESG